MPRRKTAWCCWNYLTKSEWDNNKGKWRANDPRVALYVAFLFLFVLQIADDFEIGHTG